MLASGDDVAAEDFGNDASGFAGAVDAMVGKLVGGKALRVEGAEAGFVAEERATGHGHAAGEEDFGGGVEPNDRDAGGAQEFGGAGLRVGAAAEGENDRFFQFLGATESGAELVSFHLAKGGFAEALEDFRDAQAGGCFDAIIEVDKAPGELAGEESANGGFAGAHEAGEGEDLSTGGR